MLPGPDLALAGGVGAEARQAEPRVMLSSVESDLRALSAEASRRSAAGLGLGAAGRVRDAAEKGLAEARAAAARHAKEGGAAELRAEEILGAFLQACEARGARLVSLGLQGLQRLVSYGQVRLGAMKAVLGAVSAHAESTDDAVQLKVLQTVLTLLQARAVVPSDGEGTSAVLSTCLRLFASQRTAQSVASTAGATLRQAVSFVFDHAAAECGLDLAPAERRGGVTVLPWPKRVVTSAAMVGAENDARQQHTQRQSDGGGSGEGGDRPGEPGEGSATATALLLFGDLCSLAGGGAPSWLSSPPVPRSFALEILEFILATRAELFVRVDSFNRLLRERVVSLVMVSLNATGSAGSASDEAVATHKLLTQTVATLTRKFLGLLPTEGMVFATSLLQGVSPSLPLWQRLCALDALRAAAGDACAVGRFASQHAADDRGTDVVGAIGAAAAREVAAAPLGEPQLMAPLHKLFEGVAKGVELTPEVEAAAAAEHTNSTAAAGAGGSLPECEARALALAVDILCGLCRSCEALADTAIAQTAREEVGQDSGQDEAARTRSAKAQLACSNVVAARTVQELAFTLLPPLRDLLAAAEGEALILEILKSYQAFTQAAGLLGQVEARDAFLASLCRFTVAAPAIEPEPMAGTPQARMPRQTSLDAFMASGAVELGLEEAEDSSLDEAAAANEAGVVLTPRNVHALRTIFNIAQVLAEHLGASWVLILQTLWALERTLASPHATTQEEGPRGADLDILLECSSMLFEQTAHLSTDAVGSLLRALVTVSEQEMREAAAAAVDVGAEGKGGATQRPVQLFAIPHMVDLVVNSGEERQQALWPELEAHLVEAGGAASAGVRAAVAEQLERAVSVALQRAPGGEHERAVAGALRRTYAAGARTQAPGGATRRAAALRACLRTLELCGAGLSSGWQEILPLLLEVVEIEDGAALQPAFACARLIISDLLVAMPAEHTNGAVDVAGAFAAQDADLNVALTAVGLLWGAADAQVARAEGRGGSAGGSGGDAGEGGIATAIGSTGGGGGGDAAGPREESEAVAAALLPVLGRLESLAIDPRPDVRNAAVRTLVRSLASSGASLPRSGWERALGGMLLPLVARVRAAAAAASTSEDSARELSAGRVMLVHHSRNSAAKQWDETITLALGGLARLLRTNLQQLAKHADGRVGTVMHHSDPRSALSGGGGNGAAASPAARTWAYLLEFASAAFREGSCEVASAASHALVTVLAGHPELAVACGVWHDGLAALHEMADFGAIAAANHTSEHVPPPGARVALAKALGELCAKVRAAGVQSGPAADISPVLGMLDRLVRFPLAARGADGASGWAGDVPAVQRAALAVVVAVVPPEEAQWRTLIKQLAEYVRVGSAAANGATAGAGTGAAAQTWGEGARGEAFTRAACASLCEIYTQSAPAGARSSMLGTVVSALGSRLRAAADGAVWAAMAHALVACAREGVSAAANSGGPMGGRQAWPSLAAAFVALLERDGSASAASADGGADGHAESIDAEACRVLGTVVAPACPDREPLDALAATLAAVLRSRAAGADVPDLDGDAADALSRVAGVARAQLFAMAGGASGVTAAMAALPQLLGFCDGTLRAYGRAARGEGGAATPTAARTALVNDLLEGLQDLWIPPDVAQEVVPDGVAVARAARGARAGAGGSGDGDTSDETAPGRTQLLLLYGPIIACVGVPDKGITDKTRALLGMLACELGLPP